MKHLIRIGLLVGVLLGWGCRDGGMYQSAQQAFVSQSTARGLYIEGRQTLIYDATVHQVSRRGASFRWQTDDQSVYLHLQFDAFPNASNPTTHCTIHVRGINGLEEGSYEFTWVEAHDGKMWLWNEKQKMGLILPSP